MSPLCAVKNCKSSYKNTFSQVRFYSFPEDKNLSKLWLQACNKKTLKVKYAKVCSLHFTDDDWRLKDRLLNMPVNKRLLNSKAVPTLNLPVSDIPIDKVALLRQQRINKRNSRKLVALAIEEDNNRILLKEDESLTKRQGKKINPGHSNHSDHTYFDHSKGQSEIEIVEIDETSYMESLEIETVDDESSYVHSVGTQTEVDLECAREFRIMELEKQIKLTESENKKLKAELNTSRIFEDSVKSIFTSGQIKKLKNPNVKIKWNMNDIYSAYCLHSAGPAAYTYLYNKNHPLPGTSTLRKWSSKFSLKPKCDQ